MIIEESSFLQLSGEGIPLEIFTEASKKCEFCDEEIPLNSRRCPYCGSLLKLTSAGQGFYRDVQNILQKDNVSPKEDVLTYEVDINGPQADVTVLEDETKPESQDSFGLTADPTAVSDTADTIDGAAGSTVGADNSTGGVYNAESYAASPMSGAAGLPVDAARPLNEKAMPATDAAMPTSDAAKATADAAKPLSNGMKVFLTILSTLVPGFGQLIGVILSIVFMNDQDEDKRSFGIALLTASIIFFILSCFFWFIVLLVLFSARA